MSTIIQETLVQRLLREYCDEIGANGQLLKDGDITLDELENQLYLLDEEYAAKIVVAVLE